MSVSQELNMTLIPMTGTELIKPVMPESLVSLI